MATPILKFENFSKTFRSQWLFRPLEAVKDLNLEVHQGEAFGFLGHNGAGKTTTIKCTVGLVQITQGKIYIDDKEASTKANHEGLSYLPELPYFYDHLTVRETLEFFASLYGIDRSIKQKRVDEALERLGIQDRAHNKVRSLSKGLQQRLGIAQAIINKPKLVILDEPFSGLDPVGRLEIREVIQDLKKAGTTIFLSSHILSDVEDLCDRVSIMAKGVLKKVFKISDMTALFGEKYSITIADVPHDSNILNELKSASLEPPVETALGTYRFTLKDYDSASMAMHKALHEQKRILEFNVVRPKLEEIFMQITGHNYTRLNNSSEQPNDQPRA